MTLCLAISCSALFACRSPPLLSLCLTVLPLEAGMGQAPHIAANDASELVAARRAARVSQVRAASILGTSEKYISMLERGQRELKPIRRAYEAWVEAGLPLDWDRQAFEAERKMDSKKGLAI